MRDCNRSGGSTWHVLAFTYDIEFAQNLSDNHYNITFQCTRSSPPTSNLRLNSLDRSQCIFKKVMTKRKGWTEEKISLTIVVAWVARGFTGISWAVVRAFLFRGCLLRLLLLPFLFSEFRTSVLEPNLKQKQLTWKTILRNVSLIVYQQMAGQASKKCEISEPIIN